MDDTNDATSIETLIPKSVNDIIKKHRDQCSLSLSSLDAVAKQLPTFTADGCTLTDEIRDWRFIDYQIRALPEGQAFLLLGESVRHGTAWMTSPVIKVDRHSRVVQTRSGSRYRLDGQPGEGEPPLKGRLHICAVFHSWGLGPTFGVPHIYY